MEQYHKIQTVYKRDPETKFKTLLDDDYSMPEFEYLASNQWTFTEKVDGTNIRVMFNSERLTFAGKTDRAQIPSFLLDRLNQLFSPQIELFKENFPDGVCLYGEGYGAKIQKGGGNYRQDQDFVLFDVKIVDWWLQRHNVMLIADQFNLDIVPVVEFGTLTEMVKIVKTGFTSMWGDFLAEGIVARPTTELKTRSGERIITKAKYKDFSRD